MGDMADDCEERAIEEMNEETDRKRRQKEVPHLVKMFTHCGTHGEMTEDEYYTLRGQNASLLAKASKEVAKIISLKLHQVKDSHENLLVEAGATKFAQAILRELVEEERFFCTECGKEVGLRGTTNESWKQCPTCGEDLCHHCWDANHSHFIHPLPKDTAVLVRSREG